MSARQPADGNPYVGPRPFETGERLYGRDQEVLRLFDLLAARRIVLFYSPSGAGKTSLIRAALIPRLVEEGFRVLPVVRVGLEPSSPVGRNGRGPGRYVLSALHSLEEALPADKRWPESRLGNIELGAYLDERQDVTGGTDLEVLILDQFEEILTLDPTDRDAKVRFFTQVGAALRDARRWALFSMREDHVAGLDPFLRHIPTRLGTTFRLDLLGPEAARLAIQRPARDAGVDFTDAAAEQLVDDLRRVRVQQADGTTEERLGPHVEPVQLQVVCHRLWEHLPPTATRVEPEHAAAHGDVDGALAAYYAEAVAAVVRETGVAERDVRAWFDEHLITNQGVRGQVLREPGQSAGLDDRAIRRLIDTHLVRAEPRRGAIWFELAHDRLIDPVRRDNDAWYQANLSALQLQAKLWDSQDRSSGYLLSEEALEQAERWAADHPEQLTSVEREFLEDCRVRERAQEAERRELEAAQLLAAAAQARQQAEETARREAERRAEEQARAARRLRWLAAALALVLISTVVVAGFAWRERVRAQANERLASTREAEARGARAMAQAASSRALASLADELAASEPDVAVLLGLEALDEADTLEARTSLLERLASSNHFATSRAHEGEVASVAFSPDGRTLVSGGADGAVRRWEVDTEPTTEPLARLGQKVTSVAFSPDGTLVAAGSDNFVYLLESTTGQRHLPRFEGHRREVTGVAFSPDGATLASGSLDGTVILWNAETGAPRQTFRHDAGVTAVAFDPNGGRVASAEDDGSVVMWSLGDGQQERVDPGVGGVRSIAFRPDGKVLAVGGDNGTVVLWDVDAARPLREPGASHAGAVTGVAFSPEGRTLASGSLDKRVILWDVESGAPRRTLDCPASVTTVAFSPDDRTVAAGCGDGAIFLWDVSGRPPLALGPPVRVEAPTAVVLTPDGATLASGSADGTVRLWDAATGAQGGEPFVGQTSEIRSLALDRDGGLLASGDAGGTVVVRDLTGERTPLTLPGVGAVESLALSPDGRTVAAGTADNTIARWDVETGGALPTLAGHRFPVTAVAFGPDGRTLASGDAGGSVILWNPATGQPISRPLIGHRGKVTSVAFSPDGAAVASGSADRAVILWDAATGRRLDPVLRVSEGASAVASAAFSPDGRTLAAGRDNGTIILWDLRSHRELDPPLESGPSKVLGVAFNPDGTTLVAVYADGTVIWWDVSLESWKARGCRLAGRNLSKEEWQKYFGDEAYRSTCPGLPPGDGAPPAATGTPAAASSGSPVAASS